MPVPKFAGLSSTGTLQYNGVTFQNALTINASQEEVLDSAGLATRFHEIVIRVRAIIVPSDAAAQGASTSDGMEYLRSRICKSGGHLIFDGKGFGRRIEVNNPSGGMRDVDFGPKPQLLAWSPIGDNLACEVEWAVKVHIPHCYREDIRTTGLMAFNYGISWATDTQGMTTRTIMGSYEIASTLPLGKRARENRKLVDTADAYWDQIGRQFSIPIGFQRSVSRQLSENKKAMQFTLTDTEIQTNNPYPDGVTNIDATHSVNWARGDKMKARNTISARITMRPYKNGSWAWAIFVQLVRQRMWWAIANSGTWVILEGLSASEAIFGFTHSFSASYRFLTSIPNLIRFTGLWQPIGTNWSRWSMTLSKCVDSRGWANLKHSVNQESIYDLCGGSLSRVGDQGAKPFLWTTPPVVNFLVNRVPPPNKSWKRYDVTVVPGRDNDVARQGVNQPPQRQGKQKNDGAFDWNDGNKQPGGVTGSSASKMQSASVPTAYGGGASSAVPNPSTQNGIDDIIHRTGLGQHTFRYIGVAERVGWEIPRQHLDYIGGQPTTEVSNRWAMRVIGNYLGVPVYQAMWVIDYVLPNAPAGVDAWSAGQVPNLVG